MLPLFLLAVAATVWTRFPLAPVIIRLEVPIGKVAGIAIVKVVVVVALLGLKPDVEPWGAPLTEKLTSELNPLEALIVTT